MSALVIPAAKVRVTVEDATLDLICFGHLIASLRDRSRAAQVAGYVEATIAANPDLSGAGVILDFGTVVALPEFVVETAGVQTRRLWD